MRETPLFSVIAVCCNVAPYAERMIGSIRAQGYAGFECLAVVEESDDGTERVIRKAIGDDPRFRVVTLPRSGSLGLRNWGSTTRVAAICFSSMEMTGSNRMRWKDLQRCWRHIRSST